MRVPAKVAPATAPSLAKLRKDGGRATLARQPFARPFVAILILGQHLGGCCGVGLDMVSFVVTTGIQSGQNLSAGEFGFVLLNQIDGLHMIDPAFSQAVLAAMLLSMLIAPFLIQYSDQIALPLTESEQKDSRRQLQSLHPGNRMRLMFGQPLLPQEPGNGPSR